MRATAPRDIGDLELILYDLRASITMMEALTARVSSIYGAGETVEALSKLGADMTDLAAEAISLWRELFDSDCDARKAQKAEYAAAMEALKAEKAAPGSTEDIASADALWTMLVKMARLIRERCAEAGYPVPVLPSEAQP